MDSKSKEAYELQMTLADKGSLFSTSEIKEILEVLRGVSLKLIITNVPSEVFHYNAAQESFEDLFRSFDNQSKFVYLPSFQRALIYMNRPEAALLARLHTQGWTLPEHVRAGIPHSSANSNNSGINCYIGDFGDIDANEINDEEELDYCDSPECSVDSNEYFDDSDNEECKENADFQLISVTDNKLLKKDDIRKSSAEFIASPSIHSSNINSRNFENQKELSLDETTELESGSKTSSVNTVTSQLALNDAYRQNLCKHGKYKRRTRPMKHLAPPKPPRLFLLSPPASPPIGWEPKPECEPVINYELLHALASLAPGETFELHPRDQVNQHPSIVITPCENDPTYEKNMKKVRIVQTKCPERNY
uniref:SJCHGC00439 protein n=1 Tax=Schistosoma japonicum TaxID=6182 RepID=Q5DC83_SCHJA|nr:SJCHGC00439 protein [Schistosoma japonicum]